MHVGVDIGGTHFSVGVLDDEYNIIYNQFVKIQTDCEPQHVINNLVEIVEKILKENEVTDIGVAIPGVCNLQTKQFTLDDKHIWKNINVISELENRISVPVYFDNDVKCATIAEYEKGSLKNIDNGMLISIGTGIGSGLIINKQLYRGSNYTAGELGHNVVIKDGIQCGCGNKGCFERYASLSAIRNILKYNRYDISNLQEVFNSRQTDMIDIVNNWLEYLSEGLANAINILDMDVIVIGGGASEYFEYFGTKLQDMVNNKIFNKSRKINVIKATFLNNAGIIGAAMLAERISK